MTRIEGFMFDVMDAVLSDRALGSYEVLPGAVEVLAALKERSVPFALLTNGVPIHLRNRPQAAQDRPAG